MTTCCAWGLGMGDSISSARGPGWMMVSFIFDDGDQIGLQSQIGDINRD